MAHQDIHRVRERSRRRFFRQFAKTYDDSRDSDRDIVWEAERYAENVVLRRFPCAG